MALLLQRGGRIQKNEYKNTYRYKKNEDENLFGASDVRPDSVIILRL